MLDQWSHVDTGDMVTVNLVDGSSVSATDHHEFWVSGDNQWVYAEDLEPGDLLIDPDGPAEIADVTYWPDGDNLVWELTIDEDHTFTVHTGTTDVVVHNANCYSTPSPSGAATGAADGSTVPDLGSARTYTTPGFIRDWLASEVSQNLRRAHFEDDFFFSRYEPFKGVFVHLV